MTEIAPIELATRVRSNDSGIFVLDIRQRSDFEKWHIPTSRNIDVYKTLQERPEDARPAFETLPQDAEIVTVCGAGIRSAKATSVLREMGYDAFTLIDGMNGWGRVHTQETLDLTNGSTLVQVARPGTGCLSYVLIDSGEAIVVDPSQYLDVYDRILGDRDVGLVGVIETHTHADHVSGAGRLARKQGVPHYLHPADTGSLETVSTLEDSEPVMVGCRTLSLIHTPGHTPGSMTIHLENEALLTGDTLFLGGVGRPDLDSGSDRDVRRQAEMLYESIRQLMDHSGDVFIFPAHYQESPDLVERRHLREVIEHNETLSLNRETFIDTVTANVPETPPNHEQIKQANVGEISLEKEESRRLELGPNRCATN